MSAHLVEPSLRCRYSQAPHFTTSCVRMHHPFLLASEVTTLLVDGVDEILFHLERSYHSRMPRPAAAWLVPRLSLGLDARRLFHSSFADSALFVLRPHLRSVVRTGGQTDYRMDGRFSEVYDPAHSLVLVESMMPNTIEVFDTCCF